MREEMQRDLRTADEEAMDAALAEAAQALAEGEIPVGAVLVRDGRIIARAHNRREALGDPTAHAELLCLRAGAAALGDWRLRDCTLYVTLEPCPMCAGAIVNARIPRVVYGAADPKNGCCGSVVDLFSLPFNHRPELTGGVLEADCAALLSEFFERLRLERPRRRHWTREVP